MLDCCSEAIAMEALPDWRKKQLFKLADKLEEPTQHWEDSYFEAAQELRVFAEGRAMVPSEDGFLEAPTTERAAPIPVSDAQLM